ncbi:Uncharacterised protein [Myroides odoratimimus]|nr:Uncharacterised protein [Myroides odoratimimus]
MFNKLQDNKKQPLNNQKVILLIKQIAYSKEL